MGDLVRRYGEPPAPILWIGRRTIDCRHHARRDDVIPVRIAAHAFAPGCPARPLRLSPDHAVFVDGGLVPVRCLVNGGTIVRETVDRVTYWHIELARHDVVLAEGLPCETYLDTGNRSVFVNAGAVAPLHPSFVQPTRERQACAPLHLAAARDHPAIRVHA